VRESDSSEEEQFKWEWAIRVGEGDLRESDLSEREWFKWERGIRRESDLSEGEQFEWESDLSKEGETWSEEVKYENFSVIFMF
jgi:hypothetical protein